MDALIEAAARALAAGDALGALQRVALRDDAPALALRAIAMAQLGDFTRAKSLVRRAARAFAPHEVVARARCVVAEAEIALAARDPAPSDAVLDAARATLATHGDRTNAAYARHLQMRRLVVMGRIDDAERMLAVREAMPLSPVLRTVRELIAAGIAIRRVQTRAANAALARAERAARAADIPALTAEVAETRRILREPAARLIADGVERPLALAEVEAVLASPALVVDACRAVVRDPRANVRPARRPVLFALARALGEAWPDDAPRATLLARAFGARRVDESHRARLRVEVGRLRAVLRPLADVRATARGFVLVPRRARTVVVLGRPVEDEHAAVLACLADGESWSSAALALALATSQRTIQRALDALAVAGKVQALGRGRGRRWVAPLVPGFTTTLLLPGALPID